MLTKLQVKNFRSLREIEIPFEQLAAVVGPNGSGKTSILRAIDLVLGDSWPSIRGFRIPQDFVDFDPSQDIEITAWFDPVYQHEDAMAKQHAIPSLRVSCKQYKRKAKRGDVGDLHVDFHPLDKDGKAPFVAVTPPRKGEAPTFRPLTTVGTELKDHAEVLFIDHRRSLAQHIPTMRGSILGQMLQGARKEFTAKTEFDKAYQAAMDILRTESVRKIEQTVSETARRMLGFLGADGSKAVQVGLGFADPGNPFNSLRFEYREGGRVLSGDDLGLGIQSAIVVGAFEAFRQLGGSIGTVVIEEPEMYLHPQAQRYFYRLLTEMADNKQCQVIYSTHSPIFGDVNRFESLRLVRREPAKYCQVQWIQDPHLEPLTKARERLKIGNKFNNGSSEVLFAKRALLVEGFGDRTAALITAEKLGLDVDAEGIAIVECQGKSGIELVARVCNALSIPFVAMHDDDIWPTEHAADAKKVEVENRAAAELNSRIKTAIGTNPLFLFKSSLEEALGIGRNAPDKPARIAEKLGPVALDAIPEQLLAAVKAVAKGPSNEVAIKPIAMPIGRPESRS